MSASISEMCNGMGIYRSRYEDLPVCAPLF